MYFANKVKHWVLQHYLWIATGLFSLSLFAVVKFASLENNVKFMIIGVPFTFLFLVQRQKLEETRLFKELFNEFNTRYDLMNEDLNLVRTATSAIETSPPDTQALVLYDYFNLCAEEYHFYSQGYIPEKVWRSWWEGMKTFFACSRIWKVWNDDPGRSSYYGFVPPEPDSLVPSAGGCTDDFPGNEGSDQRDVA